VLPGSHPYRHGEKAANSKLQETARLPVELMDVDAELARLAASLKAQSL
jgi:hypothetical protein